MWPVLHRMRQGTRTACDREIWPWTRKPTRWGCSGGGGFRREQGLATVKVRGHAGQCSTSKQSVTSREGSEAPDNTIKSQDSHVQTLSFAQWFKGCKRRSLHESCDCTGLRGHTENTEHTPKTLNGAERQGWAGPSGTNGKGTGQSPNGSVTIWHVKDGNLFVVPAVQGKNVLS